MITLAFAAIPPQPTSFQEHFDVIWIVASIAIMVVCWFLVRTLKKIDANQADLFRRLNEVEIKQARLTGEHDATCGRMIKMLDELSDRIG